MRFQMLHLPNGAWSLIVDQAEPDDGALADVIREFAKECGARSYFVTTSTVEVPR